MSLKTIFEKQDGRCFYCDCRTWLRALETRKQACARLGITSGTPRARVSINFRHGTEEHLIRKVDGGKRLGNLVMACSFCNSHRGTATVEHHKALMLAMVATGKHPCHGVNPLAEKRRPWRGRAEATV